MSAIETRHFKALQINFPEVCLFYIKYNEKEFAFFLIYFFCLFVKLRCFRPLDKSRDHWKE